MDPPVGLAMIVTLPVYAGLGSEGGGGGGETSLPPLLEEVLVEVWLWMSVNGKLTNDDWLVEVVFRLDEDLLVDDWLEW